MSKESTSKALAEVVRRYVVAWDLRAGEYGGFPCVCMEMKLADARRDLASALRSYDGLEPTHAR